MAPKNGIFVRAGAAGLALVLFLSASVAAAGAPPPAGQIPARAEKQVSETGDRFTLKEAGREFLSDTGRIWSSPARIKNRHVAPLIFLAAATTFLITADEPIRNSVQSYGDKHAWAGDVSRVITRFGQAYGWAAAGAFFGAGLLFKDDRARDTGYLAANAMLQGLLVDTFFKAMTGRQRPFATDGEDRWYGPAGLIKRFKEGSGDTYSSFPSGHTATAFALATVVSLQYRHHVWVPALAYTLATGVGLSRMTLDKHWASDVLVGAVLGHLVARLVVRDHDRRRRVVPMLACTGRAVAFSVFVDLD